MRRIQLSILALTFGALSLMAAPRPAATQAFAPTVELYTGEGADGEGVKMGGWGSGTATADRAYKTVGANSIKVETNGYYSGARIEFEVPKDLTATKADPFAFLEFIIRFQPGTRRTQQNMGSGGPGSPGGLGAAGAPGNEGSGSFGAGFPGFGPGIPGAMGAGEAIVPDTRRLKVVLKAEEGMFVASNFPIALFPAAEEGWFAVAIPFVAFKGLDQAQTCKVKEIRVFGDNKDTFWIGHIKTTSDDEPIQVDSLEELETSVGEPVEFRAQAQGGISPLQYIWDFDQSDGPTQEDAIGPSVVHVFRRPSNPVPGRPGELQPLVVTLTVKDLSGAKKPVRRTASVIVNP